MRGRLPQEELEQHHDVAGFVYGVIGVLYGVVLAFVVVIVWEQHTTVRPNSAFETNWHAELVRQMSVASDLRQQRLSEARGGLPRALWMVLVLGAIVNVGFTLMFGV